MKYHNEFKDGVRWSYVINLSAFIIQSAFTIVLVRILLPSEWGIFNISLIFINFFTLFQDMGLGCALINRKNDVQKSASVVFYNNILLGLIWFLFIYFIAPFVALYFKNINVEFTLRFMAMTLIINSLSLTQTSLIIKELEFKKLFYINFIPILFSGTVSIILALLNKGVWALLIGFLIGKSTKTILVWWLVNWKPNLSYDLKVAGEMWRFGMLTTFEIIFGWFISSVDSIFIGRFLGAAKLGIYYLSYNISRFSYDFITVPLQPVFYPTFCKLQNDRESLKIYYFKYIYWIVILILPITVLIFFTASYFVPIFLGNKWSDSVILIRLLIIFGILASLVAINAEIYRAIGRPDVMPKFFFARAVVSLPIYYYAATKGVINVCIAHIVLAMIFVPVNIFICKKIMNLNFQQLLRDIKIPIVINLLIIMLGVLFNHYILQGSLSNIGISWKLLYIVLFLVCFYLLFFIGLYKKGIVEVRNLTYDLLLLNRKQD